MSDNKDVFANSALNHDGTLNFPEIVDYDPAKIPIKLGEENGQVLASVHSYLSAFQQVVGLGDQRLGQYAIDKVVKMDSDGFNQKFPGHISLDQFMADVKSADDALRTADVTRIPGDDVNMKTAKVLLKRAQEIPRDYLDHRMASVQSLDGLPADTNANVALEKLDF